MPNVSAIKTVSGGSGLAISDFATFVYRRCLVSHGLRQRLWHIGRELSIRAMQDPACQLLIHGRQLYLPLSHALPIYLARYPQYDRLPRRISAYVHQRFGQLTCIDIGANIGDTLAAFYQTEADYFLAVEPDPTFYKYLVWNWGWNAHVTSQSVVCAMTSREGSYKIEEKRGTASVVKDTAGTRLEAKSLDVIVSENPRFAGANVLKIDTDGNDFEVLSGGMTFIKGNRPIILFECYQGSNTAFVDDGLRVMRQLVDAGYERYLVYDNYGYLMGWHSLADSDLFRQLMFYQLTSRFAYMDLLIMPNEDAAAFLEAEVDYFADQMSDPLLRPAARSASQTSL